MTLSRYDLHSDTYQFVSVVQPRALPDDWADTLVKLLKFVPVDRELRDEEQSFRTTYKRKVDHFGRASVVMYFDKATRGWVVEVHVKLADTTHVVKNTTANFDTTCDLFDKYREELAATLWKGRVLDRLVFAVKMARLRKSGRAVDQRKRRARAKDPNLRVTPNKRYVNENSWDVG